MSRIPVIMPKMSMTMTEGEVASWLVKVGDQVAEGDVICEVMTDKVDMEVESTVAGRLAEIVVVGSGGPMKSNQRAGCAFDLRDSIQVQMFFLLALNHARYHTVHVANCGGENIHSCCIDELLCFFRGSQTLGKIGDGFVDLRS